MLITQVETFSKNVLYQYGAYVKKSKVMVLQATAEAVSCQGSQKNTKGRENQFSWLYVQLISSCPISAYRHTRGNPYPYHFTGLRYLMAPLRINCRFTHSHCLVLAVPLYHQNLMPHWSQVFAEVFMGTLEVCLPDCSQSTPA